MMRFQVATIGLLLSAALLVATGCGPSAAEKQQAEAKVAQEQQAQAAARQREHEEAERKKLEEKRQREMPLQVAWVNAKLNNLPSVRVTLSTARNYKGVPVVSTNDRSTTVEVVEPCVWRFTITDERHATFPNTGQPDENSTQRRVCMVRLTGLSTAAAPLTTGNATVFVDLSGHSTSGPLKYWIAGVEDSGHVDCDPVKEVGEAYPGYRDRNLRVDFKRKADAQNFKGLIEHIAPQMCGAPAAEKQQAEEKPAQAQQQVAQVAAWPSKRGEYIAASSAGIPPFPQQVSGYVYEADKDFWGSPFRSRGTLRIFGGNDWEGIYKFPNTMNHCDVGTFMIRWRSANPHVRVESSVRYSPEDKSAKTKTGSFGYMSGSNCQQPMFKFASTNDGATLTDIYYELKFWQAAP